jgi:Zn-dependent protease
MAFIGSGDIFGEIPSISDNANRWAIILSIVIMMNLITFVFNLIPFPPLDGWKITQQLYEKSTHKRISENVEIIFSLIGFVLIVYIFISGIVCDFVR